jgi:hypothetical protein
MPSTRFTGKFGSLPASAIGYNNRESLSVMSTPIMSLGTFVIVLAGRGLARAMPRRSGTC